MPAQYEVVGVSARLTFEAEAGSAARAAIASNVHARLKEHFRPSLPDGTANERVDFGFAARREGEPWGVVAWSDVFSVVRDTPGVARLGHDDVLLNGEAKDVQLALRAFPVLGNVLLADDTTGELL